MIASCGTNERPGSPLADYKRKGDDPAMKKSLPDQIPAVTPAEPHAEQHAIEPDSEAELEILNLQLRAELQAIEIDPQFAAHLRAQLVCPKR